MVNTDTFTPIAWDKVPWREEGVLYRGCVEGDLSQRLYDTCENSSPSYFGIYSRFPTDEKFTWTRSSLESVLYYPVQRTVERGTDVSAKIFPWNRPVHPLIMKINARPYKNNLGFSKNLGEQDGVIMRGAIDLDDIEVLYSSKVCTINKKMRERIADDIKRQAQEWYPGQKYDPANYFQTEGFLDDFERDPERMKAMFLSLKFTDGRGTHQFTDQELEAFERFISSLRKLR
ncbi:TPA: hypothetical protein HA242_01920 [Candidatus Woesearchaeota archaeon]|nr:hypothetical protein [Candidatus Woesearchaeota archaeon]HIH12457.1 hypothetical protein [Candidatus Woesearchaeota archaeon]